MKNKIDRTIVSYKIIMVLFLLFFAQGLFATDGSDDNNTSSIRQNNQIDRTEIYKIVKEEIKKIEKNINYKMVVINLILVIIGLLIAIVGIVIPILIKPLYDDVKRQKEKIEDITNKSEELFNEQKVKFENEIEKQIKLAKDMVNNYFKEMEDIKIKTKGLFYGFKEDAVRDEIKKDEIKREENIKKAKELSERESSSQYEKDLAKAIECYYSNNFYEALNKFEIILHDYKKEIAMEKLGNIYFYIGYTLKGLAKTEKDRKEKERLYNEAIKKYEKAIDINPINDWAYNGWGWALKELAKINENTDEEKRLYEKAIKKYKKAIDINPNHDNEIVYSNLGWVFKRLADTLKNTEKTEEREKLYKNAIEKFKKAIKIDIDDDTAYRKWGLALAGLAKINKNVEEKERLYKKAIKKHKKAIDINSKNDMAYSGWGYCLLKLSKLKNTEKEKNDLLDEAEEKLRECTKLNGHYRNLVRLYAITNEKDKAFEYMEKELKEKDDTLFKYFDEDEEKDFDSLKSDDRYKALEDKYGNK